MLALTGVTKTFAGKAAVENVSLTFESGRTYALIGPSGCGKSTLLRLLMGLIGVDAGTVMVGGESLESHDPVQLRGRFGYVIQDGGLFPHLTAEQNVHLPAAFRGWSEEELGSRTQELCRLAHIPGDSLKRFPTQLSGGQRQRVSLMRALMINPEFLLLDEPLGALDPMIRIELQQQLREIFRSLSKTVVLVTHDLNEAAFFADEIVLMRAGRVVQQGSLRDLMRSPADPFVEAFLSAQQSHWDRIEPGAAR